MHYHVETVLYFASLYSFCLLLPVALLQHLRFFSFFLPFFFLCNCFFLIWFGPMYRSVPFPHSSFFVDCIFQYFALTHPSFFSTPLFFSLNNHIGLITRSLTDKSFAHGITFLVYWVLYFDECLFDVVVEKHFGYCCCCCWCYVGENRKMKRWMWLFCE